MIESFQFTRISRDTAELNTTVSEDKRWEVVAQLRKIGLKVEDAQIDPELCHGFEGYDD